jgi:hypothetical protein
VDGADFKQCNICGTTFARQDAADGLCPACGLGPEHRGLRYILDNYGNVVQGRAVLALGATGTVPRDLLRTAADVSLLDWNGQATDETILLQIPASTQDAVMVFRPPARATSRTFVENVARILRPGGVLVAIEPAAHRDTDADVPAPHLAELAAAAGLIVTILPGLDPVLRETPLVVMAYRTS